MSIETIFYRVSISPSKKTKLWPLGDTFKELQDEIREYFSDFTKAFKIQTSDGNVIYDDKSIGKLKQALSLNKESEIDFCVLLDIDLRILKSDGLHVIGTVKFLTNKGFDNKFIDKATMNLKNSLAKNRKNLWNSYHLKILLEEPPTAKNSISYLNNEHLLFEMDTTTLCFIGLKGYSDFSLRDLDGRFEWDEKFLDEQDALRQIATNDASSSPFIHDFIKYKSHFAKWNMEKILKFLSLYLSLVRISLDPQTSRSEANRRLILNAIFLTLSSLTFRCFSCEYYITQGDMEPNERIGNGPLDFMIKEYSEENTKNIEEIAKLGLFKENITKDELNAIAIEFKQYHQDFISTCNTGKKMENEEEEDDDDDPEEIPSFSLHDICEAKDEDLNSKEDVQKCLPQLISQLIDGLTLSGKKRKRNPAGKGEESTLCAKGILSSGQTTLFFQLVHRENQLPLLKYLGKVCFKVFDQTTRKSGFAKEDAIAFDETTMEMILKSFYIFFLK